MLRCGAGRGRVLVQHVLPVRDVLDREQLALREADQVGLGLGGLHGQVLSLPPRTVLCSGRCGARPCGTAVLQYCRVLHGVLQGTFRLEYPRVPAERDELPRQLPLLVHKPRL